ncbi:MAG: sulfatase-like hydrolase/transferase [Candidatus Hydrogenedentes bacterium]|nr:sulfatase-like hydrolase/transferase [Candidatus Hydrogenedentota bacterium]
MVRREFLALCGMIGAGAVMQSGCQTSGQPSAGRKPNVVLIVADDLGYGELSVQGSKDILTPNIDSIARNGVRFTDGYVTCPVCSPTRAGLMTGRYQQRFGHEFNPGPQGTEANVFGLPLSETTLPQRMKQLGYATGMVGKWHLGNRDGYYPTDRGFDEFYGFLGGAHSYVDAQADSKNPILRGKTVVDEITYTTDDFAREACGFIDRHQHHPFFLYAPFNAVHNPMDPPERYIAPFASIKDEKRRKFAAMLTALDTGVGNILGKLNEHDLTDNTLVIFISDNGGPTPQITSQNGPLRGFKSQLLEGGIRVPFMMQWPGGFVPAGVTYSEPVISLDILPTIVSAAGGKIGNNDACDGLNLWLSFLSHPLVHEALFWRQGENFAVRKGNFKLVQVSNEPLALYDLSQDIHEDHNLIAQLPDKANELRLAWNQWNSQNIEPLWERRDRQPQRQRAVTR